MGHAVLASPASRRGDVGNFNGGQRLAMPPDAPRIFAPPFLERDDLGAATLCHHFGRDARARHVRRAHDQSLIAAHRQDPVELQRRADRTIQPLDLQDFSERDPILLATRFDHRVHRSYLRIGEDVSWNFYHPLRPKVKAERPAPPFDSPPGCSYPNIACLFTNCGRPCRLKGWRSPRLLQRWSNSIKPRGRWCCIRRRTRSFPKPSTTWPSAWRPSGQLKPG